MGYQIFEKTIRRDTEPRITISTLGRIQFNASAARILEAQSVEAVLLLWDTDAQKMAMKKASKKDDRTYQVRYAKKGKGAGFASKTFLEWCHYDYSKTRNFPCKWNESESMFEISLATASQGEEEAELPQRPPRLQSRRAKGEREEKGHAHASL